MATSDVLKLVTPDGGQPVVIHTDMKSLADQLDARIPAKFKRVRNTASGGGVGSTPINLAPVVTIPATPFGAGVPYLVEVSGAARATCLPNASFELQARVDGTTVASQAAGNPGAGTANIPLAVKGALLVTNPGVSHTASVTVTSAGVPLISSLLNDKDFYVVVVITPAVALP